MTRRTDALVVERIDNTVIARTMLGRDRRVVLGGHLDTVPANGNADPVVSGDTLHGVGSADMKGGLAVLLRLAEAVDADASSVRHDVTFALYEGEEVRDEFNGLRKVNEARPELLDGDFAVLLEPTDTWVEAGCQGVLVLEASFVGARAHTARPWMGVNAIHRAADVLARIAGPRVATSDRRRSRVPRVTPGRGRGGWHPGQAQRGARLVHDHRRPAGGAELTLDEAEAQVRTLLDGADSVTVLQAQAGALPNLTDPLVADFVSGLDLGVRPKLGWTDVARFASRGVPAVNFGPGDPEIAHTAGEFVTRDSIERRLRGVGGVRRRGVSVRADGAATRPCRRS